jgi:hypothetical protein
MKKILLLVILCICAGSLAFGQAHTDSITFRKHWYGARMYNEGKEIKSVRALSKVLNTDQAARSIFRKAKNYRTASLAIMTAGYAYVLADDIYVLSETRRGNSPAFNPIHPYIVAGMFIVSIPFGLCFHHQMKKSIRVYNEDAGKTSYRETGREYYLRVAPTSVGVVVGF